MQITQRSVCLVAVLHVLAFSTILCEIDVERKKRELSGDDLAVQQLLQSSSGFLAGEDTPVWIAALDDNGVDVNYENLANPTNQSRPKRPKMVKMAIDYWKSREFRGLPRKARRSVDENADIVNNLKNLDFDTFSTSSMANVSEKYVEKRDLSNEVYHPSLLLLMDSELGPLDDEYLANKAVYEKILYALAFANGIDLQLRRVKNPRVRLRVAGIVIAKNKEALPYLRLHEDRYGLDYYRAHTSMMKYWRRTAQSNPDFRIGAYDIVLAISDSLPRSNWGRTTHGVSSPTTSCLGRHKNIAGVLAFDDQVFGGIQTAVHEISHVLSGTQHDGDTDDCPWETGMVMSPQVDYLGRTFSQCSLDYFSKTLKYEGWCLRDAKEIHPPGKPVEAILPGKLMPAKEQCRGLYYTDPFVCWDYVTCDKLYCANNNMWSSCRTWGPPPDGTTCSPGKMCLDGKCVSNTTAFT